MTTLEAVADRVARGDALSDQDARAVLDAKDLIAIGMMADDLRRRMRGTQVTFCRVFEFHVGAPPSSLPPGTAAGEIRIAGRPASEQAALEAVRAGASLAAGVPLTGFSLADLVAMTASPAALEQLCAALHTAGLEGVAEAPVDALEDAVTAIAAARRAGLAVRTLTVHSLDPDDLAGTVRRAREIQARAGGIRAFAPLPRTLSIAAPTTGYDDVKQVALARMMAADIESIQVDWALYGPKLAQVALTVGADDVDSVAAVDPGVLGTRRSPLEEIKVNIRAASLEPVERNGRFEPIARA